MEVADFGVKKTKEYVDGAECLPMESEEVIEDTEVHFFSFRLMYKFFKEKNASSSNIAELLIILISGDVCHPTYAPIHFNFLDALQNTFFWRCFCGSDVESKCLGLIIALILNVTFKE